MADLTTWHEPTHEHEQPWYGRKQAWAWIMRNCNGIANVGACPICGERVMVRGDSVTTDGRIIGTCGDAFTVASWEKQ